jgi:hypothetical protein
MKFITDRKLITETVLREINPEYDDWALDHAIKSWWQNPRKIGGLMLTPSGDKAFDAAGIEAHTFPITEVFSKYYYIMMDRHMLCPHFVDFSMMNTKNGLPTIRIYDSRIALMVDLYDNFPNYFRTLLPKD